MGRKRSTACTRSIPGAGEFKRERKNQLACGLLVADETSMADVLLMRPLLAAVPKGGRCQRRGRMARMPISGA